MGKWRDGQFCHSLAVTASAFQMEMKLLLKSQSTLQSKPCVYRSLTLVNKLFLKNKLLRQSDLPRGRFSAHSAHFREGAECSLSAPLHSERPELGRHDASSLLWFAVDPWGHTPSFLRAHTAIGTHVREVFQRDLGGEYNRILCKNGILADDTDQRFPSASHFRG